MGRTYSRIVRIGVAALASAALLSSLAGCNMVYGLGTDLQSISDTAQTFVFVDDPRYD
jgi:predicted small secreted protein